MLKLNKLAKRKISILYRITTRVLIIKNGAKGISVLAPTFLCESNIINIPTTAPIQNDSIMAASPFVSPSIHPIPSTSFASPNPIHLPRDSNQRRAKGSASRGPETISRYDAFTKKEPIPV